MNLIEIVVTMTVTMTAISTLTHTLRRELCLKKMVCSKVRTNDKLLSPENEHKHWQRVIKKFKVGGRSEKQQRIRICWVNKTVESLDLLDMMSKLDRIELTTVTTMTTTWTTTTKATMATVPIIIITSAPWKWWRQQ